MSSSGPTRRPTGLSGTSAPIAPRTSPAHGQPPSQTIGRRKLGEGPPCRSRSATSSRSPGARGSSPCALAPARRARESSSPPEGGRRTWFSRSPTTTPTTPGSCVPCACQPSRRALLGLHSLGGGGPGKGHLRPHSRRGPRDHPSTGRGLWKQGSARLGPGVSGRGVPAPRGLQSPRGEDVGQARPASGKARICPPSGLACVAQAARPPEVAESRSRRVVKLASNRAARLAAGFLNRPRSRARSSATRAECETEMPARCRTAGRTAGLWCTPQEPCATGWRRSASPPSSPR